MRRWLLKRRNEKLRMKKFHEFVSKYDDPAEGESAFWCMEHNWNEEGTERVSPQIRRVV